MNNTFYDVKPTPRLYGLLIILALILAVDIVMNGTLSRETILASAIITGSLFALRMLVDLSAKYFDEVVFKRVFLDPLTEDRLIRVKIIIENRSIYPLLRIHMIDKYPNLFKLERGSHTYTAMIPSKTTVSYTYVVKPVIGKHVFGPLEVIVSDPFKLFNYKVLVDPEIKTIYVKPKPSPIPVKLTRMWVSRGLGFGKTRVHGLGQEFFMLREYYPGDDYRFIDWKSYARLRRLYVKVFEREANLSVVFLIDASRNSMRSRIGDTPLENMVRVVAGLSRILIKRGDWIDVVIRSINTIRSGYGRGLNHYYRILDTLSRIEWMPEEPRHSLGEILLEEATKIPRRSKTLFFLLTVLLDEQEINSLMKAYEKLRESGHLVYVVQLLPELFEHKLLEGLEASIYYGFSFEVIKTSRRIREQLMKHGIYVVSAGPHDLLEQVFLLIERFRMVTL